MNKKEKSIFSGAFILGVGTFIAKFIGALYRIPLTALIGASGIGLYQLVFPVYTVMLDFSGAGAPTALSKIISSYQLDDKEKYAHEYLSVSIKVLFILGLILTFLMAILSYPISYLQGNIGAFLSYILLSPSILLVCLISSFRGYFQGLMQMKPTAISQIIEQLIKLFFGLLFAKIFIFNIKYAVAGAIFSITLSEIIAFIFLYITYVIRKRKLRLNFSSPFKCKREKFRLNYKKFIKTLIPVALIGICIPFSHLIDSFLTVNILSKYTANATALFGILTGVVATIINLPVAVCYGVSMVSIPLIAGSKGERQIKSNKKKAIWLTLLLSIPCAIILLLFSNQIISLLFRNLVGNEKSTAVNLLKITSPSVVLLSLLQTSNSILIGKGKLYYPVFSMSFAIIIKIIVSVILLNIPSINIYGMAIGLIACYFVADLINLIKIFKKGKTSESLLVKGWQPTN